MTGPHWQTIHRCVSRILVGESTLPEREELALLLNREPEARRVYVAYMQESAELRWLCSDAQVGDKPQQSRTVRPPAGPPVPRRESVATWLVAASLLVLTTTFGYSLWTSDNGVRQDSGVVSITPPSVVPTPSPMRPTVATVSRLVNARWAPGVVASKELSRLKVGDVVDLKSGEIELVFDEGVELLARGASRFRIESPLSVYGEHGTLSARVGESGRGFTINTSAAQIIDRGTQFGVSIDADGKTDVACFEGEVELSSNSKDDVGQPSFQDRLLQGEGLSVASEGTVSRLFCISDTEYPSLSIVHRYLPAQPQLILSVRDSLRDPSSKKFYRIVPGGMGEDVQAFVDRPHQWNGKSNNGLPKFLIGADYVMTFNDDKFAETFEMEVEISQPVTLYLMLSDAVAAPKWLTESFEDTNTDIGLDEGPTRYRPRHRTHTGSGKSIDTHFSVWQRVIEKPMVVRLGGIDRPEDVRGYNMYALAAKALSRSEQPNGDAAEVAP